MYLYNATKTKEKAHTKLKETIQQIQLNKHVHNNNNYTVQQYAIQLTNK